MTNTMNDSTDLRGLGHLPYNNRFRFCVDYLALDAHLKIYIHNPKPNEEMSISFSQ